MLTRQSTRSPDSLPGQPTSFVGRKHEMAEIKRLLRTARLVTLLGMAGRGKTRLVLQLARRLLPEYPDGVWFVTLAHISDAALVPQEVASVLSIREQSGEAITATLARNLRNRRMLLVLDNCEHLVETCALLAGTLLAECPQLQIVATSRQTLGVESEELWPVPPLSFPDLDRTSGRATSPSPQKLAEYEAVRLFIERARNKRPDFVITEENAPLVAQLCCGLEGLPLAIELAAARMSVLSLEQITSRLDERFRLLAGGNYAAPPRQQTLQAAMDWSYHLLPEAERALFRSLSVFSSDFSLEAARSVCALEIDEYETIEMLSRLVDKSLVTAHERQTPSGCETRYRLLVTIRQYAAEKLQASGEASAVHDQHLDWYTCLAEKAAEELRGPDQIEWGRRLDLEHDNLRAALEWALQKESASEAVRLSGALWHFWSTRGHIGEGRRWLTRALDNCRAQGGADVPARLLARAYNGAGVLALGEGDYEAARRHHESALALRRTMGDKQQIAGSLNNLGVVMYHAGDYAQARGFFSESLQLFREVGHTPGIASPLNNLGEVLNRLGEYEAALSLFEESLQIVSELGDKWGMGDASRNLGAAAAEMGDYASARSYYEKSLSLFHNLDARLYTAYCLEGLAAVEAREIRPEQAARLLGAADRIRREIGSPLQTSDIEPYERTVAAVRAALSDGEWRAAWDAGQAMPREEAVACALQRAEQSSQPPGSSTTSKETPLSVHGLTERETEVLRLVTQGLTDSQIAFALNLSVHTVNAHTRRIYLKLGVSNRSAATRYAVETGLL